MRDLLRRVSILLISACLPTCQHSTDSTVEVLPPTSHDFNWTFYSLGSDGDNTLFSDVTIVNDTLVYVSGQIHLDDSTGRVDGNPYNLARWNGREWSFRRIPFYSICGQPDRDPSKTQSVSSIDGAHIFLLGGAGEVATFADGDSADIRCLPNTAAIEHLWAASTNSIYAIGLFGNLLHFDGSNWQMQTSGTSVDLSDVCGTGTAKQPFACGYTSGWGHSALLRFDGQSWSTLWRNDVPAGNPPFGQLVLTVWQGNTHLYAGTEDGVFRVSPLNVNDAEFVISTQSIVNRIRGSAENNIAAACDDGSIWHYNGETWENVLPREPTLTKPLRSIAVSPNMIVGVGFDASALMWKGWAVVGRRK